MSPVVIRSLQYRLAGVVSFGLLLFAIMAGGITFYLSEKTPGSAGETPRV
jgi:hypothetical protein